jgi:predicted PurR-regulated permease PerM
MSDLFGKGKLFPCYNIGTMAEKKKPPAGSSFWQILVPMLLAALLAVLLGAWFAVYSSPGNLSRFAEISTVLLVIPVFFAALVFALLLVGLIYLVQWMMDWIPRATGPILEALQKVREIASRISGLSARVVIEPAAFLAGIRRKKRPPDREISLTE